MRSPAVGRGVLPRNTGWCTGSPTRQSISSRARYHYCTARRTTPRARQSGENRIVKRSGVADLPLHGGRVPAWLADRMTQLGAAIVESILLHYGHSAFLSRLSDPYWFQALGSVMGMDWHSSGITTSVVGALKRGLTPRAAELGL